MSDWPRAGDVPAGAPSDDNGDDEEVGEPDASDTTEKLPAQTTGGRHDAGPGEEALARFRAAADYSDQWFDTQQRGFRACYIHGLHTASTGRAAER